MIKKVCLVVTLPTWGGAQRYVHDLAIGLSEKGYELTVVSGIAEKEVLYNRLNNYKVDIVKFPNLIRNINLLRDFLCLIDLFKYFKINKFDVIHLNSSKAGVLGALAAKLAGCNNIVFTAHGFVFNEKVNMLKKLFYLLATKINMWFVDKIIAVSDFDKNSANDYKICPANKITRIYNGINLAKHENNKECQYFLNTYLTSVDFKEKPILLSCIANFYENKGLRFLIDAMSIVSKKFDKASLIIIGDGILRKKLEDQINDLNLMGKVKLVGYIDDPEKYLHCFDVYICSSLKEGLPYSLIDATACGLPVIATDVGGNPEIIRHDYNGLIVRHADSNKLATAINRLLVNFNDDFYKNNGLQIVRDKFDINNMIRETLDLYEQDTK